MCGDCVKKRRIELSDENIFDTIMKEFEQQMLKEFDTSNCKDLILERKKYYQKNKPMFYARAAKRRAMKRNQTPDLTKEEKQLIQKYYEMCQILGTDKYEVDHHIPIAKGVEHHPDNLQIITKEDNRAKSSKLNYTYLHPRIRLSL